MKYKLYLHNECSKHGRIHKDVNARSKDIFNIQEAHVIEMSFILRRTSLYGIEQGEIELEAGGIADASILKNLRTIGI